MRRQRRNTVEITQDLLNEVEGKLEKSLTKARDLEAKRDELALNLKLAKLDSLEAILTEVNLDFSELLVMLYKLKVIAADRSITLIELVESL